jgi:hypothetical protein
MKKTIWVGMLLVALSASAQQQPQAKAPRIPDAETAFKIAERLLVNTYGRRKIDAEKPLSANLIDGVWFVSGTLWCSDGKGERTREPGRCLVLQLQIAFAEGAGGFNPLKMSRYEGAFRPGSAPPRLNTTVVLRRCRTNKAASARRQGPFNHSLEIGFARLRWLYYRLCGGLD